MNTPQRGRGRGAPRGASRGDRGGGRGRGGRGGRGGAARADLSSVEFNYEQLASVSSTDFGFAPGPPQPAYVATPQRSYPPTPNHNSPGPSGYSTPRRGLAFNPAAAARGRGDFASRGARGGRGGGLGFSSPQAAGVGGPRPFLVPVKFVKAQALPAGLGGDEELEAGELETHVHAGVVLPESVHEPQVAEADEPAARDVAMSPPRPIALPLPLFVSDVHPSPVAPTPAAAFSLPTGFVLGLTPRSPPSDSSDSDSDQIVFQPQHQRSSAPMTSPPSPSLAPTLLSSLPSPAASLPSIATAPPSPRLQALTRLPPPLLIPAPKLSKNAKKALQKAGKKARKNGKEHARSGNQHLVGGSSRAPDAEDRAEGDAMMDRILGVGVEDMELESDEEKPREGDSDLEWGDTLPPKRQVKDAGGLTRKEKRKLERRDRLEMEHVERLAFGARVEVELALEPQRTTRADLAADDYAANVGTSDDPAQGVEDLSFLLSLIGGTHKTIDELADSDRSEDAAGWQTTSGEESSDPGSDDEVDSDDELEMDLALGEADAQVELAIAQAEDALMGGDSSPDDDVDDSDDSDEEDRAIEAALLSGKKIRLASMGQAGPGGRRDKVEKKRAKKGKGRAPSDDDDSSDDDDDDGPGRGGGTTWADDDEDYIRGLQDIMDDNADLLDSRDRKSRKKLFKAIQDGDFRGVDFDDDAFASSSVKKASSKKPKPDFFAAELQAQWEKDRTKKGAFKRARALARAEAADAPRPGKHSSSSASSSDAASLNLAMREFILDAGRSTLSLPPMSKKSRVAVHLLAEVYSLKSKSLGSGKNRYPVLERTTRSAVYGVDERKVAAIVGTAAGEASGKWGGRQSGKMGGLWAALGGEKSKGPAQRGGGGGAKNREGVVVGVGAERIGSDNIGFALLQKMGWKEGEQIGMSGGIHEPIAARVKTNKSGLGSGYSISRFEAQAFAAGPSR